MFGIKKNKKIQQNLINQLSILSKDTSISEKEREIVFAGKARLEKNEYMPRVLRDMESALRPMALQSKLSKPVGELYLTISGESIRSNVWSGIIYSDLM